MTRPASPKELSAVVQKAVQDGLFTLPDLADDIGIPVRTLRSYVYGQANPSPQTVQRIARALAERGKAIIMLAGELARAAGKE